MTASGFVLFALGLEAFIAVWALVVPDRTRPDLLFAVTVDPAVRRTARGRAILAAYRRGAAVVAVVSIASCLAGAVGHVQTAFLVSLVVELAGLTTVYYRAHRRTQPFAAVSGTVRESALDAPPPRLPALWAQLGPFAILAAAAVYLHAHWSQIPVRFPVHWTFDGRPDRWATRTAPGVYGELAVAAVLCAGLLLTAWATAHRTRQIHATGKPAEAERQFRRTVLRLLLAAEYFVTGTFALVARAHVHVTAGPPAAIPAAALVFAGGTAFVLARMGQGGTRLAGAAAPSSDGEVVGDRTDDRYWRAGVIYINRADPALLIEKRFGGGYTMNFARPAAWAILALILLGVPFVAWLTRH